MTMFDTIEYAAIRDYYAGVTSARSGVKKINHIIEGMELLEAWDRPPIELQAFCLHPLVQMNVDSPKTPASPLALDYAIAEDKYLCRPENDHIEDEVQLQDRIGNISESVAWMLLADKVQNQKDFRKYHWFTHERAYQLEAYFNLWIKTLRTYYL